MTADLGFRLEPNGWPSFEQDWQAMLDHLIAQGVMTQATADASWQVDEDGNRYLPHDGSVIAGPVRYDLHYMPQIWTPRPKYDADGSVTNSPVNRGRHCNIRVTPLTDAVDVPAIQQAVIAWYSARPWDTIKVNGETKAAYVHTLPNGTEALALEIKDEGGNIVGYSAMPRTPNTVFA